MHPSVKLQDPEAPCPICGMDLTPVQKAGASQEGHSGDISHYTCPMHPSVKASEPGSCPICGMDLAPVPKPGASPAAGNEGGGGFITLTSNQQQLIGVTTGLVSEQQATTEIRTIGRVAYDETRVADVNLKVSGWIRDLFVDYVGKTVRQGEPLFTLYSPDLVASQDEYLLAYRGFNRVTEFGDSDGESGSSVWSQTLLSSARERLELWDLTAGQIRALETTGKRSTTVTIHAPSDGIVAERMAVAGMFVKPDMRLYRIARLDSVWIKADVYEHELPFVHVGQHATLSLSYLPGVRFEGIVDYVYPYLDPKSRTATVRISTANREELLKPDMFADVLLHQTPDTRLLVPEAAVLFSGRRRIVFVALGEGRFQPREVSVGRRFQAGYEVLQGLRPGDRVVTSANFLLDSESKLKNVTASMMPAGSQGESP